MSDDLAPIERQEIAATTTPASLLQMAIQRGVTTEQLAQLLDLQERWERNQARKEFEAALAAFKANPPSVVKNKLVSFGNTRYSHATLDNVCDVLGPALAQFGFSYRWRTDIIDGKLVKVTCILTHRCGHSEETSLQAVPDNSGSKNAVQAIGSTTSYLQRYTLLAATGIAVQNADDDGRGAGRSDPTITDEQVKLIADGLNATRSDWDKFLAMFRITDLAELRQSDFARAKELIDRKRGAK